MSPAFVATPLISQPATNVQLTAFNTRPVQLRSNIGKSSFTSFQRNINNPPSISGRNHALPAIEARKGALPGKASNMPQQQPPQLPQDGTPVFAIYLRTPKAKIWYPVGAVKGDKRAKSLMAGMKTGWGRRLYGNALNRGVAQTIYNKQNFTRFLSQATKQFPQLKKANKEELEFGFKIISTEIEDFPTTLVTKEMAMPFFQWLKYKISGSKDN